MLAQGLPGLANSARNYRQSSWARLTCRPFVTLNSRPASGRLATNSRDPRHVVNRVVREAHTKEPPGSSEKYKYYEYYVDEPGMRSIH